MADTLGSIEDLNLCVEKLDTFLNSINYDNVNLKSKSEAKFLSYGTQLEIYSLILIKTYVYHKKWKSINGIPDYNIYASLRSDLKSNIATDMKIILTLLKVSLTFFF